MLNQLYLEIFSKERFDVKPLLIIHDNTVLLSAISAVIISMVLKNR